MNYPENPIYFHLIHLPFLSNNSCHLLTDGYNQQQYQWIANDEWWYTSDFNVTRELYERQYLWLQCDGVDTAATIVCVNALFVSVGTVHCFSVLARSSIPTQCACQSCVLWICGYSSEQESSLFQFFLLSVARVA